MQKHRINKDNIVIISSDCDNLGVLLAIFYLMDVRGYSYSDANKYVVGMRFKINLTQNFQTFLRYLYVPQDQRPESPKELEIAKSKVPVITLEQKPVIKLEDTFQVKLRKRKLKKTIGPKQVIDELSPDDAKLQDALESLYSQVKK